MVSRTYTNTHKVSLQIYEEKGAFVKILHKYFTHTTAMNERIALGPHDAMYFMVSTARLVSDT